MTQEQFINNLKKICNKVYSTGEKYGDYIFIMVENREGTVVSLSIPRSKEKQEYYGVKMGLPITPNRVTGSSLLIERLPGRGEFGVDFIEALRLVDTQRKTYPSFFTDNDIQNTHFEKIEQTVNRHGNILDYKLI